MDLRRVVISLLKSRRATPSQNTRHTRIEVLEQRIAPASLISSRQVTFTDVDGDKVTIEASAKIFKAGKVNKILDFDTGSVNGSDAAQQLQLINLSIVRQTGVSLTITAEQQGSGDGFVDIGFINGRNRDLGTIEIDGDLGRIAAGQLTGAQLGMQALIVNSIGARGTTTQAGILSLESR
ncbi:MAG TPA: hypothetical protein VF614_17015, partial [Chthoniobacteraceae bacterium]